MHIDGGLCLWLLLLLVLLLVVLFKLQVRLLSKQLYQGLLDVCFCFSGCAGKYFIVILSLQETNRYSAKTVSAPGG